ncbi:MAG: DUF2232 domain-containing protein [Candidatus Zixiibacteriota bacterium]
MRSRYVIPVTAAFLTAASPFLALIPVIGYLLQIVTALAVMMAVVEQRVWYVIGGFIVAIILGSLVLGSIKPVSYLLPELCRDIIAPLLAGVAINQGRRAGVAFIVASLAIAVAMLWYYIQTADIMAAGFTKFADMAEKAIVSTFQAQGYGIETINGARDKIEMGLRMVNHLTPGMLIMSGMIQVFIALILIEWYYLRRDSYFPGFGSFLYWKIPEYLLYIFGVALIVRLAFDGYNRMIADNILLILSIVYCVTGLSFMEHLLRKLRMPMFLKVVFYIGMLITGLAGFILAAVIGLFDSFFDFRKTKAHTLG